MCFVSLVGEFYELHLSMGSSREEMSGFEFCLFAFGPRESIGSEN